MSEELGSQLGFVIEVYEVLVGLPFPHTVLWFLVAADIKSRNSSWTSKNTRKNNHRQ